MLLGRGRPDDYRVCEVIISKSNGVVRYWVLVDSMTLLSSLPPNIYNRYLGVSQHLYS